MDDINCVWRTLHVRDCHLHDRHITTSHQTCSSRSVLVHLVWFSFISSPIHATERWARNWSLSACRCLFWASPAVACHYCLPGLQSPSQPKNVTILQPVPSDTAWWQWQRHIGVNNLPKVVTQLCPAENWTHYLPIHHCVTLFICLVYSVL